jgi:C1A family cysteine protease
MNKFLIVLLFALAACDMDVDAIMFQQFQKFIKKYHKKYNSVNEFLARYEVFRRNTMATFKEENSYRTGITKFSDLTQQEFAKTYLNLNYDAMAVANFNPHIVKVTNAAPDAWDWRDKGYVSPIKDQGSCGSCWAFSTIANLEGLYYKEKGVMVTMSEQMLVDCDTIDSGCNGGLMENTFTWLKENGGIMTDDDYPYTGYKGSCKSDPSKYVDMKITGYKKLGSSWSTWSAVDEEEVKEFLYETGPLAIALNADYLSYYTGGIVDYTSSQCPSSGINHAVTLVGYGTDESSGMDYWIIKNSWGSDWGEYGYFRIRRGNGTCGVNCYITTATVSF